MFVDSKEGFWLNQPDSVSAEGSHSGQTSSGEWWRMRGTTGCESVGNFSELNMFLLKLGECRDV